MMTVMRIIMRFARAVAVSLCFILLASAASVAYAYFAVGSFSPAYVFDASFAVGAFLILCGLAVLLAPATMRKSRLFDHTTAGRWAMEAHGEKRERAYALLGVGIAVILVAGAIQLIAAAVL